MARISWATARSMNWYDVDELYASYPMYSIERLNVIKHRIDGNRSREPYANVRYVGKDYPRECEGFYAYAHAPSESMKSVINRNGRTWWWVKCTHCGDKKLAVVEDVFLLWAQEATG